MGHNAADTIKDHFLEIREEEGRQVLVLSGAWTIRNAAAIEQALSENRTDANSLVNADHIEQIDTAGAWLIRKFLGDCDLSRLSGKQKKLLDFMPDSLPEPETRKKAASIRGFFIDIGKRTEDILHFLYDLFVFIGKVFICFLANFLHPRRFRLPSIARHIYETGIQAIPLIGMLGLGISMVVSYQGAIQLKKFGADIFTIDLTVISILREMGVLTTAIMIAGRSGSAFAAEIGVMKLRHEVDALKTMGMDPIETLVLPRLLALLIALPILTFFADILGLAGGGIMSRVFLDIPFPQYLERAGSVATFTMFFAGMIKAPVFAFLIAVICTFQGLNVSGSAESVGRLTTVAVVQSIFLVIMADAIFSIIFANAGI